MFMPGRATYQRKMPMIQTRMVRRVLTIMRTTALITLLTVCQQAIETKEKSEKTKEKEHETKYNSQTVRIQMNSSEVIKDNQGSNRDASYATRKRHNHMDRT